MLFCLPQELARSLQWGVFPCLAEAARGTTHPVWGGLHTGPHVPCCTGTVWLVSRPQKGWCRATDKNAYGYHFLCYHIPINLWWIFILWPFVGIISSKCVCFLQVLSHFHQHKKQKGVDAMLLRLYEPFIWRSLQVGHRTGKHSLTFFLTKLTLSVGWEYHVSYL